MIPADGGGGVSVADVHHIDNADSVVAVIYRDEETVVFVENMSYLAI